MSIQMKNNVRVYEYLPRFKLRRLEIGLGENLPSTAELTDHINFLRSDHARFWYSNETSYQMSLRSLLFTDTGIITGIVQILSHG
jgi:hypothetical protein